MKIRVHYTGYSSRYEELVDDGNSHLIASDAHRIEVEIGIGQTFYLRCENGALIVSSEDGPLSITPVASNVISVTCIK